jgi:hypothetical protein
MSNTFNIKRTETNGDGVALYSVAHPRPTNKIDVIIDALSVAQNSVWSALNQEALAYAVELKLELAKPEQEPVAWMLPEYGDVLSASEADGTGIYNVPLYTAPQKYCPSENNAAYEKGFVEGMAKQMHSSVDRVVNTMGREWVGLTNDEINDFSAGCHLGKSVQSAISQAAAKLKELNT